MQPFDHNNLAGFVDFIVSSKDLELVDKISILKYTSEECYLHDKNLLYLECKQGLKELEKNV